MNQRGEGEAGEVFAAKKERVSRVELHKEGKCVLAKKGKVTDKAFEEGISSTPVINQAASNDSIGSHGKRKILLS